MSGTSGSLSSSSTSPFCDFIFSISEINYTPPWAGGYVDITFTNTGNVTIEITDVSSIIEMSIFGPLPIVVAPGETVIFTVGSYNEDMAGHGFTIINTCSDFGPV